MPKISGLTLIELLVAMSIFSILAVLGYHSLITVIDLQDHVDKQSSQLANLQRTFNWLKRDIEQSIPRPIRDEYDQEQPALQGSQSHLELTRTGWSNPAAHPRGILQRVHYQLKGQTLWRAYWSVLDRAQDSQAQEIALLTGVEKVNFRFLDASLHWHDHWPPNPETELATPVAVEVSMTVSAWGTLIRLFQIPELSPQKQKEEFGLLE